MGFAQDTEICTVPQAQAETHEAYIANLDDDASATFLKALQAATNELIRRCRSQYGIDDPSTISNTTVTDARLFAACWALFTTFASLEQEDKKAKAESYKARAEEQWRVLRVSTTGVGAVVENPKGVPVWSHMDPEPYHPPTNNRFPLSAPRTAFRGRPNGLRP